mmetsp:Transcript_27797/g.65891  ORF Transcript_27797/g.65891 Transcript_27797/m.65891 type:complete len:258 (-) Transcript_27797:91-864(-)
MTATRMIKRIMFTIIRVTPPAFSIVSLTFALRCWRCATCLSTFASISSTITFCNSISVFMSTAMFLSTFTPLEMSSRSSSNFASRCISAAMPAVVSASMSSKSVSMARRGCIRVGEEARRLARSTGTARFACRRRFSSCSTSSMCLQTRSTVPALSSTSSGLGALDLESRLGFRSARFACARCIAPRFSALSLRSRICFLTLADISMVWREPAPLFFSSNSSRSEMVFRMSATFRAQTFFSRENSSKPASSSSSAPP